MKEFTFNEFVESLKTKLDSIHGNKGLDSYSLIVDKEAVEDDEAKSDIKELEKLTGENIYQIDKGRSALYDFFKDVVKDEDKEKLGSNLFRIKFEHGVNFYIFSNSFYIGGCYMNVRNIDLPPKKTITVAAKPRLFLLQRDVMRDDINLSIPVKMEFFMLPFLKYPSSIKDVMKWLKKKKLLKTKGYSYLIWNKDCCKDFDKESKSWEISSYGFYMMKNIKTEDDLVTYNDWLETFYKGWIRDVHNKRVKSHWGYVDPENIKPLSPTPIPITQEDINQFVAEYNNRFKIVG